MAAPRKAKAAEPSPAKAHLDNVLAHLDGYETKGVPLDATYLRQQVQRALAALG